MSNDDDKYSKKFAELEERLKLERQESAAKAEAAQNEAWREFDEVPIHRQTTSELIAGMIATLIGSGTPERGKAIAAELDIRIPPRDKP